ncbi:MAG: F0F1 ATP synthase subunit B [Candidatus Riflebacteria bacterium]|nr:F0F1 ATP synthase subunit B [Candidatus Riflebacteria bacterium]
MNLKSGFFVVLLLTVVFTAGMFPGTVAASTAGAGASVTAEAHAVHQPEKGHGEPGMFDISWGILISQTLNFFVLLYLLKSVLFAPVNQILQERKKLVLADLTAAEESKKKSAEIQKELEKRLGAVEEEAYRIKQDAISDAQAAKEEILTDAKVKSGEMFEKTRHDIMMEKKKAWVELRERVVKLSLMVAEKVIEKSLDEKSHHELIAKSIDQLEKSE